MSNTLIELVRASVTFPVRKDNLGMSGNFLDHLNIGGKLSKNKSGATHVVALDNISLEISAGERVGLFGVNGAGKTTMLKLISGVLPTSTGRIMTSGNVSSLLNIGLGVDAEMTGYENLLLRMIYEDLNVEQKDEYVAMVLDFSELGDFFYLPFKTYSSGMRARLLLALSTLRKPDILIMDEWISAGDIRFRAKADEKLRQFVDTSGILVLASHSKQLLENWTERGIWIDKGVVRGDGPIGEVLPEYINFVNSRK